MDIVFNIETAGLRGIEYTARKRRLKEIAAER